MRILWFLRRQGNSASSEKIQEFVVGGEEYAIAIRKLKLAGAVSEA